MKKILIITESEDMKVQRSSLVNAYLKETRSVTMNIFRKKSFLFKSFIKIELSYVFTINRHEYFSTAENCIEK